MWFVASVLLSLEVKDISTWAAVAEGPCATLRQQWPQRYGDFQVHFGGEAHTVSVHGGGGRGRAAAALTQALLSHVVGYSTALVETTLNSCEINSNEKSLIVSPAAPDAYCQPVTGAAFDDPRKDSSYYLFAFVPFKTCLNFVTNSTLDINSTFLQSCDFMISNTTKISDTFTLFVVVAKNETKHDLEAIQQLKIHIHILKLPLTIEYYSTDILFRKRLAQLQRENKAFLFIDEDIWNDLTKVYYVKDRFCFKNNCCPLYTVKTIAFGNFDVRRFAPPIYDFFNVFKPRGKDLRQILEFVHEFPNNNLTIEDAACSWALNNTQQVQKWTRKKLSVYKIITYFCKDDPDLKEHIEIKNAMKTVLNDHNKDIKYNITYVNDFDCNGNENYISGQISALSQQNIYDKVIGAVVWNSGITASAVTEAEKNNFTLMLAGPNPPHEFLDSSVAVHSPMATISNITYAYAELLKRCRWSRVAILTDESTYSIKFSKLLLSKNKLVTRERTVHMHNIDSVLEKFRSEDARIFFVNSKWDIANKILCAALKKGMTPAANIMWLVRDWRAGNCFEEVDDPSMHHFTIGVSWRGGPTAGGSHELKSKLQTIWNTNGTVLTGTAGGASLADALLLLGNGFASFLRDYPSLRFYLRDKETILKFNNILENFTINGSAQQFKGREEKRLLFIEKWKWNKGETIKIWHVTRDRIEDVWQQNGTETSWSHLIGNQVLDRKKCFFLSTGDEFAPQCHFITFIIGVTLVFLAVISLYIARRLWLSSLKRIDEEKRKEIFSSLDGYLIKRNSLKLIRVIGSGSNGVVSFAELHKSGEIVTVAAKEPIKNIPLIEVNEFLSEACILASLRHENILRLVGICVGYGPPIILTEHAFYSDLQRYLLVRRQFVINPRQEHITPEEAYEVSESELTRFAKEAAGALEYLAENRLVHRDVRAANCLIDKRRTLKLADFGLARELYCESNEYIGTRARFLPILCMAPECLKGVFSTASDVWALGILILEVATLGARPYGDWPLQKIYHYVLSGGHPPFPPDISTNTRDLVMHCCQYDEQSRPSAKYVHKYLKNNPCAVSPALLTPDLPKDTLNIIEKCGTPYE